VAHWKNEFKPATIQKVKLQSLTLASSEETEKVAEEMKEAAEEAEHNDDTMQAEALDNNKGASGEEVDGAQEEEPKSSDEEPEPIHKVDPKEWQQLHDEWLHAAMQAAMGDTTLKSIPDLDNVKWVEHNPPQNTLVLTPARPIICQYDLCLKVAEGEDQINLFHQVFTKWYNKVCKANSIQNHLIPLGSNQLHRATDACHQEPNGHSTYSTNS